MTQNEEKKQYKFFQTPKVLKKLDPYEWVLFTVLFDEWQMMKNEEGWFFRSENKLSEDTGLSPATIYRKTKSLEEKDLILVKRHSDGKTKSERYKSNDYKINIETVISLAPIESHQKENESHQKDEPTNNIPTNKQHKINNINIKTSEVTPDDGTFQDEENKKYKTKNINMKKSNSVKSSVDNIIQSDDVNNINSDELFNLNEVDMSGVEVKEDFLNVEENERSDNETTAMNAISEQSERQARENESSESGKENEMITSTLGDKNNTSKGEHNVPVVNPKDKIIPHPAPAPQTQNKATGEPQNETDVFNRISEILEEALVITDVEPFKAKLQEALDLLRQVRPNANTNAFTRCCDDTIYWFKNNNWDNLDMFFVASDFKRDIERMKRA